MRERWHVKHWEGPRWGQDELDDLAYVLHPGNDVDVHCKHIAVDPGGRPYLLDDWGNWYDLLNLGCDDVVVVWDG